MVKVHVIKQGTLSTHTTHATGETSSHSSGAIVVKYSHHTSDQALTNSGLVSHGTCRQTGLPSILLKLGVAYAAVKKNSRHKSCPCRETGGLECFLA